MTELSGSDGFRFQLKMSLQNRGLPQSVADRVADNLVPEKIENGVLFIKVTNGFLLDSLITPRIALVKAVALDCFGVAEVALKSVHAGAKKSTRAFSAPREKNVQTLTLFDMAISERVENETKENQLVEDTPCLLELGRVCGHLSPEMTFETYVEMSSNATAMSACRSVVEHPGKLNNPVFLCGPSGVGKTHLVNAVANALRARAPQMHITLCTTEEFISDFVSSVRTRLPQHFELKYKHTDVLIVDDIHFLEGREGCQREFFHRFNELTRCGKQVILTSDTLPIEIPGLSERLKSRFQQGLIVEIFKPGVSERGALLSSLAKRFSLSLSANVTDVLAKRLSDNVRQMVGFLATISAENRLLKRGMRDEEIIARMHKLYSPRNHRVDPEDIQKVVADHMGVGIAEMVSASRAQRVALPRQIAMYLCREMLGLSTPEIANYFGKRDHTTVLHSIDKIKKGMVGDVTIAALVKEIDRKIEFHEDQRH